jgi:hypothetical protein
LQNVLSKLGAFHSGPESLLEVSEPRIRRSASDVNVAVPMLQATIGVMVCPFRSASQPLTEKVLLFGPFPGKVGDKHGAQTGIGVDAGIQLIDQEIDHRAATYSFEQTRVGCHRLDPPLEPPTMPDMFVHGEGSVLFVAGADGLRQVGEAVSVEQL